MKKFLFLSLLASTSAFSYSVDDSNKKIDAFSQDCLDQFMANGYCTTGANDATAVTVEAISFVPKAAFKSAAGIASTSKLFANMFNFSNWTKFVLKGNPQSGALFEEPSTPPVQIDPITESDGSITYVQNLDIIAIPEVAATTNPHIPVKAQIKYRKATKYVNALSSYSINAIQTSDQVGIDSMSGSIHVAECPKTANSPCLADDWVVYLKVHATSSKNMTPPEAVATQKTMGILFSSFLKGFADTYSN